ncbi:HAD family phosphatase [Streptomyces sp. NBC_01408]|uniref:HAD family hydrolase n=1 Tax=Streptomyces sp. NBC_01408 TaxID=2903855 RepID=UPI00224EA3A7|nr:HAD family hydrolase [Streptomyces sp. NBC_01408]MCX4692840.1 HAD family hydrolase [Streptomyces sp. NBC_01408]
MTGNGSEPVELVIFDCDGVLVDSEPIAVRTHVALGAELGWPLTEAEVMERFVGRSTTSIGELIADRVGPDTARIWDERFREMHALAVDTGLTSVDGIEEALDGLEAMGFGPQQWCIASSGSHEKMRHTLGRVGLYDRFEGRIFSAHEVERGKPAPDLFLHAARSLGVDPARCAVVEDSRFGIQAATAAGMRGFGYAGGLTPAEWLTVPGTVVFTDMRQLPALLAAHWAIGVGHASGN